ncbi:hypothetical protein BDQ17DRAFT_1422557 [Cyathus striatus]|nr:hypothetical protein BDQ17DRAFT_1422557 [Cyathus striatus]
MQQSVITRETLVRKVLELSKRVSCQGFVIDLPGNLYTANGATMLSLELVKGASDACPAVPLKAASAVVLILLDTAQKIQTAKGNKKNLLRLAINSLEIAYVMLSHYHDTGTGEWKSEIPKDHVETIFRFVEQVYSVYLTAEVLRNRPWFKRFFSAKLDVDTIKELRETLDHARHVFEFGALLETNRDARELRQILPTIVSPSPSRDLLNSEVTSEFTDSLSPQPPLHPVSQPPPAPSTPQIFGLRQQNLSHTHLSNFPAVDPHRTLVLAETTVWWMEVFITSTTTRVTGGILKSRILSVAMVLEWCNTLLLEHASVSPRIPNLQEPLHCRAVIS